VGGEQTLDNARTAYWVQAEVDPSRLVHVVIADANDDLQAFTWDGAAWRFETPTPISTNLTDRSTVNLRDVEPFALTAFPGEGGATVHHRSIGTRGDYGTSEADGNGSSVTATQGSTLVTGSGAVAWRSFNRGRGDVILIDGVPYTVAAVVSETALTLATPYAGTTSGGKAYSIRRQFATLQAWEDCISFAGSCGFFPVASADLVEDNRREIGIAYADSPFTWASPGTNVLTIDGTTTDPARSITLTADGANRHYGGPGAGVVVDNSGNGSVAAIAVYDDHVTVEWLEVLAPDAPSRGISVGGQVSPDNLVTLRYLVVHDTAGSGIHLEWPGLSAVVANSFVYRAGGAGIAFVPDPGLQPGRYVHLLANTVWNAGTSAFESSIGASALLVRNNIAARDNGSAGFTLPSLSAASSHNLASDATGVAASPAGGGLDTVPLTGLGGFNLAGTATGDLHLLSTSVAIDAGAGLAALIDPVDIDAQVRPSGAAWDVGADEFGATTAVSLMSFEAAASDAAVTLTWRTASELDNLGFLLHRAESPQGPVAGDHAGARSRARLLAPRGRLLLGRHGADERRPLLLPPRGRGHAVGLHLPRARLRGARGPRPAGGGRRSPGRRRAGSGARHGAGGRAAPGARLPRLGARLGPRAPRHALRRARAARERLARRGLA
jgi:hypothetical protein